MLPTAEAAIHCDRPCRQNKIAMNFDLIANFYVHVKDEKPRFRVPLGIKRADDVDHFTNLGFVLQSCQDGIYVLGKDVDAIDLILTWTDDKKDTTELFKVIRKQDYDRIELIATGSEYMDDEYWHDWIVEIDDTIVSFTENAPLYPVLFVHGIEFFYVDLSILLTYFNVDTMFEVMERLEIFKYGNGWTFEELREYFTKKINKNKSAKR